jgi:hypothetical protein
MTKKTKHNLPLKKTLKVVGSDTHPTLYTIVYHEGGTVPHELSIDFSSKRFASQVLQDYLRDKEKNKSYLEHVRDKENAEIKDKVRV